MPERNDHQRALEDGARSSREAAGLGPREALHLVVWRRYKWWIVGAGLLLLEAIVMSTLGGTMARHF
jgi:hypothetical protein